MNVTTAGSLAAEYDGLDPRSLRASGGAKWRVPPDDVLPAWVADMDFPVAEPIRRRLSELGAGSLGYPDWPGGVTPLREVFAARMAGRYGWSPDPAEVREFTDITQAVQVALYLGTEPGDGVAVHTPAFRPFLASIEAMGRRLVPSPMVDTCHGWTFDPQRLARDVAATGCRALLLVNPHNPTGRVFTREELRQLADVAQRHDLLVISDEVHADLAYQPHRHLPFAALDPAVAARTITVTSATKAFNLAGLRCAVGHVGPARLRAALAGQPSNLFGTVNVLGVNASIAAWTECDEWLAATMAYLSANRALVADVLAADLPRVGHHCPDATYLSWLDCRLLGWGTDPARVFQDRARVALSPGPEFNPGGDGFARLNFATSRPLLRTLLARLVETAAGNHSC